MEWVWVRPPPVWEIFPHNPVFLSDCVPNDEYDDNHGDEEFLDLLISSKPADLPQDVIKCHL